MDLQQQLDQWPVGAAAIAVIGPDGVLEEARTGAATADTVYRWASVTKVTTALTVLDAVLDGAISLDDPAGPPGATVRHLLAHAAGVRMEAADGDRPLAAPGTRRIYSNHGIELAAEHLAAATGRPFVDELTDRVLEPLGMTGAELVGSPAHGLRSPLADLARLGRELLHSTELLPGAVAAVSTLAFPGLAGVLPGFGRQEHNDWGLGCEIRNGKSPHWTAAGNAPSTFGHFGQSGSFLWADPVAGLACASLCDTPFGPWAAESWPATAQLVLDRYR
ncbi:serine hydrolase domain-containing protein [Nakamurella leprariae]|uniref:Beta-lactamase family protein n=1 Tax=Nakamurella leprariae TaxID=2803911 RepID=A0A938YFN9_9ACTN|nr:serine hydrolase domain-containing protein [Nakamurella leprariae]MBM9468681.1 beta-lactamase family protein [Nakamurella leprariae]